MLTTTCHNTHACDTRLNRFINTVLNQRFVNNRHHLFGHRLSRW
ncbi:Uncharacterised protein [Vibrio cholerae]|nr:Uncharacterised protein [Vibrio cholerae]